MSKPKLVSTIFLLLVLISCNRPIAASTPDLFATLQASTPDGLASPAAAGSIATPTFHPSTQLTPSFSGTNPPVGSSIPPPSSADQLTGHIVYTCQLFKVQAMDQICIMNADGSSMRRLTTENNRRHYYGSLAPDGQSILYSSYREDNVYEIYSLDLKDGRVEQLTDRLGVLLAAEISPDGTSITMARGDPNTGNVQIMTMDRNGEGARNLPEIIGWDPTWSPDGQQILFASRAGGSVQLFVVNRDGEGMRQVSNLPAIRGRSDWSADGRFIVTYSGPAWNREVYLMNADGSSARQLTPTGGNSQGPSISPDGKWVVFTAYYDHYRDDHGCEIYVIRTNGTDLRRLTDNDYCDYQPRWGP
jgi:TolB protein